MHSQSALVDTQWLWDRLEDGGVIPLDASWYLPSMGRDPRAEYGHSRIPRAVFFDLDGTSDPSSPFPHMLPTEEAFAQAVGALGIGDTHHVVVYDTAGLFSAPRVWWMFRVFGHEKVSVLNGGLLKWRTEGRPLESALPPSPTLQKKTASLQLDLVTKAHDLLIHVQNRGVQVVDARSQGRFLGKEPEPRPGVRSGHIPGSCNLPYTRLLTEEGELRSPGELRALFSEAGVRLDAPVVTSCGSGVTAAVLTLALYELDHFGEYPPQVRSVYDGSWAEWGFYEDFPLAR